MTIQDQIIAALQRMSKAWQDRDGNEPWVSCEFKVTGRGAAITLQTAYVHAHHGDQTVYASAYSHSRGSIDSALAAAEEKVLALRTTADELADLYAGLPLPAKIEEAA